MINKFNKIKSIIFPSKKINFFVIAILFLGVTSGAIFSNIIDLNDKNLVIDKIQLFISNIDKGEINSLLAFKNSIITNLSYSLIIWVLGLTIIGIIFNIFLLYIKGFIFGFSLSAFIITYSYKGITLSLLYTVFGQLLNLIVIIILTIYSIMFTINLLKQIVKNKQSINLLKFFKNYSLIFLITIIISLLSSVSEAFLFPTLIKLIIKLFI
ncbi:MAG: stage II sporulation protein M [Bacilli bacterium]|nr:stage II sporulation protein M [Bacilli bacterium]